MKSLGVDKIFLSKKIFLTINLHTLDSDIFIKKGQSEMFFRFLGLMVRSGKELLETM